MHRKQNTDKLKEGFITSRLMATSCKKRAASLRD